MTAKPASTYDVDILRRIEDTTLNDQELARDAQILNDFKASDSEIRTFFKDRCILITGVTGFVGKVMLEKLMRSCPEISTVFLLIRKKKGKDLHARLDDFFEQSIFERLYKEHPNFRRKIIPIEADVEQLDLGITDEDRQKIQQQVSVILHAAANVRFDDPLRKTVLSNVRGTAEILKLAAGCPRLVSFVHFSTAYSFSIRDEIYEEFYDPPIKPIDLIKLIETTDDDTLNKMTPSLLGKFPNNYAFSKAVTEDLVKEYGKKIPICLFRPSIIVGTYREPVRGWADNIYGATGVLVGAGVGLIHTLYCDPDKLADIVPVDMVANAAIACAWQTAQEGLRDNGPLVYNYVSTVQKPITWAEFRQMNKEHGLKYPTMHAIWYYSFTLNKNWYVHLLAVLFLHFLPAYIVDAYCWALGREVRMVKTYKKIQRLNESIAYFTTQDWDFSDQNVQSLWKKLNSADQHLFHFNLADVDWDRHAETYLMGLRVYFIKDPASTLPEARKKWRRMKALHIAMKIFFSCLAIFTIGYLLLKIVM